MTTAFLTIVTPGAGIIISVLILALLGALFFRTKDETKTDPLGFVFRQVNTDRRLNEAPFYNFILIKHEGTYKWMRLTDAALKDAIDEADKQPEDWPEIEGTLGHF